MCADLGFRLVEAIGGVRVRTHGGALMGALVAIVLALLLLEATGGELLTLPTSQP